MFSEGFFDRWRRQVGNTYIIRHVGEKPFSNYIEINMLDDSLGARLFAETKSVEGFYLQVSMLHGDELKQKENTLIFMDEIQAYPHLLTLLKFLSQDNQFTYIAKGGEDNLSADLLCDALLRLWILPRGCAGENRLVAIRAYLKTQASYINCTKSKNAVE